MHSQSANIKTLFKSLDANQDKSSPNPLRRNLQPKVSQPGQVRWLFSQQRPHKDELQPNEREGENLPRNLPQIPQLPNPHALTLLFLPTVLKTSSGLPLPFLAPFFFCSRSPRIKRHSECGVIFRGILLRRCFCFLSQSGLVGGVMRFFNRLVTVR
jgi:hypothetical protein